MTGSKSKSKMKQTPASSKRKSKLKKRTPSSSSPSPTPRLPPTNLTATPSTRKRVRPPQSMNKPSTRRKSNTRRQLHLDLEEEDENSANIDTILKGVSKLVRGHSVENTPISLKNKKKEKAANALTQALKRADELFNEDMTDTSSTDNDDHDNHVLKLVGKNKDKKASNQPQEKVDKSIREYKKDIDSLKEDDPEFYKFLEENDSALLDLDDLDMGISDEDDENLNEEDDAEQEEGDEDVPDKLSKKLRNQAVKKGVIKDEKDSDESEEEEADDDDVNDHDEQSEEEEGEEVEDAKASINRLKQSVKSPHSSTRRRSKLYDDVGLTMKGSEQDDEDVMKRGKDENEESDDETEDENEESEKFAKKEISSAKKDRPSARKVTPIGAEQSDVDESEDEVDKEEDMGQKYQKEGITEVKIKTPVKSVSIAENVSADGDLSEDEDDDEEEEGLDEGEEDDVKVDSEMDDKDEKMDRSGNEKDNALINTTMTDEKGNIDTDEDSSDGDDDKEGTDDDVDDDEDNSDPSVLNEDKGKNFSSAKEKDMDKTGYSSDETEDDNDEAVAAHEAGIENGVKLDQGLDESDGAASDDEEEEGKVDVAETDKALNREPNSEAEEGDEDNEQEDEQDSDIKMNEENETKATVSPKHVTVVDLKYLRELKDRLKSKRALSACKELLKIMKAGRNILPKEQDSKKKGLPDKKGRVRGKPFANGDVSGKEVTEMEIDSENDDMEEFGNDGIISAQGGKVRFVSSRAYEQAMNLAIIGIQDSLDSMLKPSSKNKIKKSKQIESREGCNVAIEDAIWNPSESPRWANLENTVVKPFILHMVGMCETTKDELTTRFLLKRMEKLGAYTIEDEKMKKRMVKLGVSIWSADSIGDGVSEATRLQSYLFLNRMARIQGNTEVVLRSCYHSFYTGIGGFCNNRNFAILEFCIACLVELWGIDMGASYNVGFLYIRELAMGLRSVLVTSSKEKETKTKSAPRSKSNKNNVESVVDKVQNWAYVNQLKLWGRILERYGGYDGELEPLVYPYVQICLGVMKICVTPRTYGMRIRVGSFLVRLIRETGVMIPVVPALIQILRCSELKKKESFFSKHLEITNAKANEQTNDRKKEIDWRSVLRVNEDVSKSRIFLHGLVDWVILEISGVFAAICKHVSMPEIGFVAETGLKKAAKEIGITEWKIKVTGLAQKIAEAGKIIAEKRSDKMALTPSACVNSSGKRKGMLHVAIPSLSEGNKKMGIERLYEVENERMEREFRLRDEGIVDGQRKRRKNDDEDAMDASDNEDGEVKEMKKKKKNKKRRKMSKAADLPVNLEHDEQDEVGDLALDDDDEHGE